MNVIGHYEELLHTRNQNSTGMDQSMLPPGDTSLSNLQIPVGMFMNMAHVPPRFYNQQANSGQEPQGRSDRGHAQKGNKKYGNFSGMPLSQSMDHSQIAPGSMDSQSQGMSNQPLTQGRGFHSQAGFSQTGHGTSKGTGFSQLDMSQEAALSSAAFAAARGGGYPTASAGHVAYAAAEGILSQDSTYQGDRTGASGNDGFLSQV